MPPLSETTHAMKTPPFLPLGRRSPPLKSTLPAPYPSLAIITSMRRRIAKMLHGLVREQIIAIRRDTGDSQRDFAVRFGLSPRTVEQRESGRRSPDRAAVALLKVIAHAPEMVKTALRLQPDAATLIREANKGKARDDWEEPFPRAWSLRW